ncbi:MotE family protein [Chelativorans salis]|uniref:MotE family protein n=1 Tax=Chelativorans salis TaxID=2978478 RepID=A0ABT2LSW6_9HYPH|nr:MotE family protein [Chelativorans sp. EGI FJ00035]MCT7377574.1 MotE family protein [Chelativorans sp. EGI FJ00035]
MKRTAIPTIRIKLPLAALAAVVLLSVPGARAADTTGITQDEVERFCTNIADAARDRRYALQAQELDNLRGEVDARIAALEEKRTEYEAWLARRDAFLAKAEGNLVQIYSNMRPDAAAERLAEVRAELAAAILMKLEPRMAGVILNEMNSKKAATLTTIMASAARPEDPS